MEMAKIEGGEIVIRVPFEAIPDAAKVAFDEEWGEEEHGIAVVDAAVFAGELVRALNDEQEDGTTLADLMLDKACVNAAEDGAEGLTDPD